MEVYLFYWLLKLIKSPKTVKIRATLTQSK